MPAYNHLIHATEPSVLAEARESLMKALTAVDEFLALHGAGEGEYAVGPHYGWSMTGSVDQVRMQGVWTFVYDIESVKQHFAKTQNVCCQTE